MNIFYLDHDPQVCAQMHNDKHCVKMILETAQILSTVHHELGSHTDQMYKPTHRHHPSTIWAGKSDKHYEWLWQLLYCLCKEYTHRYGRIHKVESSGLMAILGLLPNKISREGFVQPPQAMPDECKILGDSIAAYRKYYIVCKNHMAKWTNRCMPTWYFA